MPRYEIRATADVEPGLTVDIATLRDLTGGDVEMLSAGVVTVIVTAEADDPARLAYEVVTPLRELSRCGVWTARRRGVLGLGPGRRVSGGWTGSSPGDDGLGGVREPRRPFPSSGSAAAAVEPTG